LGGRYAYYRDKHDGSNEEMAREQVEAAWDELRAYQQAAGVAGNLTNLRSGLSTECA
jgi:hypothetical protein